MSTKENIYMTCPGCGEQVKNPTFYDDGMAEFPCCNLQLDGSAVMDLYRAELDGERLKNEDVKRLMAWLEMSPGSQRQQEDFALYRKLARIAKNRGEID